MSTSGHRNFMCYPPEELSEVPKRIHKYLSTPDSVNGRAVWQLEK
jgi:hypothetical protein